jgi:histidine triad (HIT) family protein
VHILLIPKQHIATLNDLQNKELAGRLLIQVGAIAAQENLAEDGYRTVINCNQNSGQEVFHLHLHILGGRRLNWPPG